MFDSQKSGPRSCCLGSILELTIPMFRKYRVLPANKLGFSLASDELVMQQTILSGCVYILPVCLGLVALFFLGLVNLKIRHHFFSLPSLQELLLTDSPPLHLLPLARFGLTGLFFSVLATIVLFARTIWRREFTRLTLTSRRIVHQTRTWRLHTQSWPLVQGTTITLQEHPWPLLRHRPWKKHCFSRLVIRDEIGRETPLAFVRDAEIFQKTAHRLCQAKPS
ncbi:MAG: hypothetical protein HQL63_00660 [Magnetococcales bacterium]|nr:hypothetical protein [Magnetococcales bacterium]MBF0322546.1 hypothetical protein [Magnetococcales bacterium]